MSKVIVIPELVLLGIIVSLIIPVSISQSSLAQKQPKAANTTASATSTNLQTYSNPAFGIKMQYPSNWQEQDFSRNSSSVLIVVFNTLTRVASLNILGGNFGSGNVTLAALVNAGINHLNQTGKIHRLISSTPATFASNPAHKIVYTTILPQGIEFEVMQLISLVGNKTYFITYAARTTNYTTYLPIIQTMINSAEITK